MSMNKKEQIAAIAEAAGVSNTVAATMINAHIDLIKDELNKNGRFAIHGFGTFSVKHREERQGRNPSTGESITIAAANVVRFTPSKTLKDAVN